MTEGGVNPDRFRHEGVQLDTSPREQPSADRFRWMTAVNCTSPVLSGPWRVKGVLPMTGLALVFGRPGSGKSLVVLDLALQIALGMDWRGRRTKPCAVSYIASEAGTMGANRIHAWCKESDRDWPSAFRMSPVSLDLRSEGDVEDLCRDIRDTQRDCGVIIVDTLARNMGGNENEPEVMGTLVRHLDTLSRELGCLVIVIHHTGKDQTRGARGHTALIGAVSTAMEVTKDVSQTGVINLTKQRDGADGLTFGFEVAVVDLGLDDDGDRLTSAVARIADAEADTPQKKSRLGIVEKKILKDLPTYIDDTGKPNPAGSGYPEPGKVRVVCWEAAMGYLAARKLASNGRTGIRRAMKKLIDKGCLCANDDHLWLPPA